MTLKKQSIRSNQTILANDKPITKEQLIMASEFWTEAQENFFKKMIKQGGTFTVNKTKYKVTLSEKDNLDSNGNKPVKAPLVPGERTF